VTTRTGPSSIPFLGFMLCLVVSGMSGLIYEVAWVRSLELVFGATSFAVATVLAAFMGGLACGSAWMARDSHRLARFRPLHVYAAIECLIGACGLLVPVLLQALVPLYRLSWMHLHASFALFSLGRLALCGAVLLLPTALMGATLPVASRVAAAGGGAETGRRIGFLYAANTFGAVLGCAAAGLALLPAIGLQRTEWLAVGLNLLAAAGAVLLDRFRRAPHAEPAATAPADGALGAGATRAGAPGKERRASRTLIAIYAISGAVAMAYEVAWSRLLVLVLGSSTYSYTIMLTTFLLGLALGAWIGARLLRKGAPALLAASLAQVLVALTTYLGLYLVRELPFLYVLAHDRLQPSARELLGVQLALAAAVMILPTLALGAMFPITLGGLTALRAPAPRVVGRAYAWNTVGAIAGSLLAGFCLIPRLGSRGTILAGVVASALLALWGLLAARPAPPARLRVLFACAVLAFVVNAGVASPAFPPEILSSGVFRYADRYLGADRERFLETAKASHGEILLFKEGLTCTVTVFRTTKALSLLVNGKPDASVPPGLPEPFAWMKSAKAGDLPTQVLVAQLPMLLAPRADRVLVVGLGSGVTLGSTLGHDARTIDCVELESAVVEGSRFFDAQSGAPLDDPRVRLVVNDARNHLLVNRQPYDVIISEPSNPWVAGAASLFTRDFFALAKSRLSADGVFCQWVQLYELTAEDFRSILRGFASVFPGVHVFRVASDAIVIGTNGRAPFPLDAILRHANAKVLADLERIGIRTPDDLLAHYWVGGDELRSRLGVGSVNTDDNMLIEFAAPLRMLSRRKAEQEAQARELATMFADGTTGMARQVQLPIDREHQSLFWARLAAASVAQGYPDVAGVYASRSLILQRNPLAARAAGEALALVDHKNEAREWLAAAAHDFPRDPGLRRALVDLAWKKEDWPALRRHAQTLVDLDPEDRTARLRLGESLLRMEDPRAALRALAPLAPPAPGTVAAELPPGDARSDELPFLLGAALHGSGQSAEAIAPLRQHLRLHPADRAARTLLAQALEQTGRRTEALAERRRLGPGAARLAADRLAAARTGWDSARPDRMVALLQDARDLDPANEEAPLLLAQALALQGKRGDAAALLEEYLEAHPDRPWAIGFLGEIETAEGAADRGRLLAGRYLALTGRAWDEVGVSGDRSPAP
jgi:spermidine synthase